MPSKREFVVRVVVFNENADRRSFDAALCHSPVLEQLRYAGVVTVHRGDDAGMCFDIHAPRSVHIAETNSWAERNAARMQSFGINAVKAPAWLVTEPKPGVTRSAVS